MNKSPFTAEFEKLKTLCYALAEGCNVSFDDGTEDDTPDVFTVNLDCIDEGEELNTLERFEAKIKEAGFHVGAAEQDGIGKAWILAGVGFGRKLSQSEEDEICETIRTSAGKSVEEVGGEAGVCGSMVWIKICGELFFQIREPQVDNIPNSDGSTGIAWFTDFKSWDYGDGGIPITVKVAYFPTEEFLNSDDDGREFLVANAEQCDWDKPVIV